MGKKTGAANNRRSARRFAQACTVAGIAARGFYVRAGRASNIPTQRIMDDIARHDGACIAEKPVDYPDYVRAYTNKILAQEKKRFRLEELRQRQAVQLGRETVLTA